MSELHDICETRLAFGVLCPNDKRVAAPCADCEALLQTSAAARVRVLHLAYEWREK